MADSQEEDVNNNPTSTIMSSKIGPFASDMKEMLNNEELSDVTFNIRSKHELVEKVYGHKVLIFARCPKLKARVQDPAYREDAEDGPAVVLSDITPDVFKSLLEFIYTNRVTLTGSNAIKILGRSIQYELNELKKLCNHYLIKNLCVDNACDVMQASVTYGQQYLQAKALDFIEQHTESVFKTLGCHDLDEEALSLVLQSDRLSVDELVIIDTVREWARVNEAVLGKTKAELGRNIEKHIRLPLLSKEELKEVDKGCKHDGLISRDHMSDAWQTHAWGENPTEYPLTTLRKGTKEREHHKMFC